MVTTSKEFAASLFRFQFEKSPDKRLLEDGSFVVDKSVQKLAFSVFFDLSKRFIIPTSPSAEDEALARIIKDKAVDICRDLYGIDAQNAFIRLVNALSIQFLEGVVHPPEFSVQAMTREWLCYNQMQDLLMVVLQKKIEFEKELKSFVETIPASYKELIVAPDATSKNQFLIEAIKLVPKTALGEALVRKLVTKVSEPDALILPDVVETFGFPKVISQKVLRAYAQEAFIHDLISKNEEAKDKLLQMHEFAKLLQNFLKLSSGYRKYEGFAKKIYPFLKAYCGSIGPLLKRDPSLKDGLINPVILKAYQGYARHVIEIIENEGVSDFTDFFSSDLIGVVEAYFDRHRIKFLELQSCISTIHKVARLNLFKKRDELPSSSWEKISQGLSITSCYQEEVAPIIAGLGSIHNIGSSLLTSDTYNRYVLDLVKILDKEILFREDLKFESLEAAVDRELKLVLTTDEVLDEANQLALFSEAADISLLDLLRIEKTEHVDFSYHQRVLVWLQDKSAALAAPSYAVLDPLQKIRAYRHHAFSILVDSFIGTRYSTRTTWINPRTGDTEPLYRILGSIKIGGQEVLGTFDFCFDKDLNYCYHRYFRPRRESELLGQALGNADIDYNFDFPPLAIEASKKPGELVDYDGKIMHTSFDGTIRFRDETCDMQITIIPVC
jgi:hypothetical protein